ncbi:Holliday junction resolvase RuvX [uncultured Fretibacterium sp.]|uniref:Holliday junction resolvase RuvX n=1 Tax=uncultured Fretibacterium sp. TaxID=1678694 RepID=UPI00325F9664
MNGPGDETLPKGRVLALDVGSVRIGAAVTDPLRVIAQGIAVWPVNDGREGWRKKFEACLAEYDPVLILIGMPIRTSGNAGPEGERIAALVASLRESYPDRTFETWDERYTTVIAQRALLEGDVSRRERRGKVDKVAAALILQSWLERRRP